MSALAGIGIGEPVGAGVLSRSGAALACYNASVLQAASALDGSYHVNEGMVRIEA